MPFALNRGGWEVIACHEDAAAPCKCICQGSHPFLREGLGSAASAIAQSGLKPCLF